MSPAELRGLSNFDFTDADAEDEKVQADDQRILDEGERDVIPQGRVTGDEGTEYILRTIKEPFDSDLRTGHVARDRDGHQRLGRHREGLEGPRRDPGVHRGRTAGEIANIAIRMIEDVFELDYCTVWTAEEGADRLDLLDWSRAVEGHAAVGDLSAVAAGLGDAQWEQFDAGTSTVKTSLDEETSDGIADVAAARDEQATSVETVATNVEDATGIAGEVADQVEALERAASELTAWQ